jgi:hypothetical protein
MESVIRSVIEKSGRYGVETGCGDIEDLKRNLIHKECAKYAARGVGGEIGTITIKLVSSEVGHAEGAI